MRWTALLLAVAAGCAPKAGQGLEVQLVGSENLRVQPAAQLTITLLHASRPLDAPDVRAQADMRHAGMGTVRARVTPLGHGQYRLSGLNLNMAGDWLLSVSATAQGQALRGETAFVVGP